jgi:hypothetical protein
MRRFGRDQHPREAAGGPPSLCVRWRATVLDRVSSAAAAVPLHYPCDFLDAGAADWEIWISTGFRSPHDPEDALHLVCGFHDDEEAAIEGLYLKRKDQAQAMREEPNGQRMHLA